MIRRSIRSGLLLPEPLFQDDELGEKAASTTGIGQPRYDTGESVC